MAAREVGMRGTALWIAAGVLLVLAGAAASYVNKDRFRDEAPAATAVQGENLEALTDCRWGEAGCILAQGLERALDAGKVDVVIHEFSAATFHTCPGPSPSGPGSPFPLCNGAQANEGRTGYSVGRRYSEGSVVDEEGYRRFLQSFLDRVQPEARDAAGDGALRLYSFACSREAIAFQNVSCARLGIVFSAIIRQGSETRRETLIFWAVPGFAGRSLPVTEVWDGMVFEGETPVLFQTGGQVSDLGVVDVIQR